MKKNILCSLLCLISVVAFAQSITLTPTSAGTNTEGKMYYSTTTHTFHYWNGTAFISLGGSSAGAGWSATGNDITNTNTGNVGVGLSSPLSKLHVRSGGTSGFTPGPTTSLFTEGNTHNYIGVAAPNSFDTGILFAKPAAFSLGSIVYSASNDMELSTSSTQRLVLKSNGLIGIFGNNALEFGYSIVGKEASAGKIGYGIFTANTLDIVGAGNSYSNRKVKVWAEGGSEITGSLAINGEITNPSKTGAANMIPIAYGVIDGHSGTILNGSGNFTLTKRDIGRYTIVVNGEIFTSSGGSGIPTSHIVIVNHQQNENRQCSPFINSSISPTGFNMNVSNGSGTLFYDDSISFVVYKP
jgi:hypothetical protein